MYKHRLGTARDPPEVFRAKLLALSQKFPMMLPQVVGTGGSQVDLDVPIVPLSSMNRGDLTFFTVASPAAGTNYYYAFLAFWGMGAWQGKIVQGATSASEGVFSTYSYSNDNLYAPAASLINTVQTNAMCIRLMNSSNLLNVGGEILMGTIPSNLLTSTLSWSTLQDYVDVKQVDLPLAQDVCFPWMASCPSDNSSFAPSSVAPVAGAGSAFDSILFCAVKIPYSTTWSPSMSYENYNNYTCTPTAVYQKVLNSKVQPVSEDALIAAKRVIGSTGRSAASIEPTGSVAAAFGAAAKLLGPAIAAYVGKKMPMWMDAAATFVGGLFTTHRLHSIALALDSSDKKTDLSVLDDLQLRGIAPAHFCDLLRELLSYRVQFTPNALMVKSPRFPDHLAVCSEEKLPFGVRPIVRVINSSFEDEKDLDSFTTVSSRSRPLELGPPAPRSASIPKSR